MRQRFGLALAAAVLALAGIPAGALAVEPTRFDVSRSGTSYRAESDTGLVYTGTLKLVVESAAKRLHTSGGGLVQFGSGTFDLGSTYLKLERLASIQFAGAGMDATILRNSSDAAADTEPFNMGSVSRFVIRDMTVDAGGAARSTSDALDFDNGNDSQVLRVKITGSRARGIVFDGKGTGWSADRNVVRDCVIDGVRTDGIQFLAASSNRIEGCRITNTGRHGISVVKASSTAATPNKPANSNVIVDTVIDQAGADGINITSGSRNEIRNTRVTNSSDDLTSRDGIRVASSDQVACSDNVIDGSTSTDTQATRTQRYGLYISSSLCARTVIGVNDFAGNLTAGIRDLGTGTIYRSDSQPPSAPTGLSADAVSPTRVDLGWNASTDNVGVAGYTVYRNGSKIGTVTASVRAYSDTTAQPSTDYSYQVDAYDAAGLHSAKSGSVAVTTPSDTSAVSARIVADTYVASDLPTSGFGTSTALRIDNSPVRQAYLRFDVQGLTAAPSRVVLRLYAVSASSVGHQVRPVSDDTWSETGTTWENAPAFGSVAGASGPFAVSTWAEVDVTSLVTGNGLHSFAITATSSTAISYASREAINDPQLVITP